VIMGSTEEIHDRERALIKRLAPRVLAYLRDREDGVQIDSPSEVEWGQIRFRIQIANAPITVTLAIQA